MKRGRVTHESMAELRKICQQSRLGEPPLPWYVEQVLRRLSIHVTRLLLPTGITANQVTLLSAGAGLVAGLLFAFGSYPYCLAAAGCIFLMEVLDLVDGEVARYRGTSSLKGKYWDSWNHFIVVPVVFVGISFGVYNTSGNLVAFVLGYTASLSQALLYVAEFTKQELVRSAEKKAAAALATTSAKRKAPVISLLGRLRAITRRLMGFFPIVLTAIQLGAIFGVLPLVLCAFAITLPCELAYQLLRMNLDFE